MSDLARLAAQWGIDPDYVDSHGRRRAIEPQALRSILDVIARSRSEPARRFLPRTLVHRQGGTLPHRLDAPGNSTLEWRVSAGSVSVAGTAQADGWRLPPDLPIGTYNLEVLLKSPDGDRRDRATLLVAPERAYQGDAIDPHRVWALSVQLYAVRSRRNWGHGDFTDLAALLRLAADLGAAGIALNPLHALFEDEPERASPYSPNSRIFLNPLYIDMDAVPEFPGLGTLGLADRADRLREGEFVDYAGVAALKRRALAAAYVAFARSAEASRMRDFDAFCRRSGRALSRFAAFEALRRRLTGPWWDWPTEWRTADSGRIRELAETDEEVRFHKFVQWIADRQLRQCRKLARRLGLAIGLYLDVAVGVDAAGADAWAAQGAIIRELSVGCPPDVFNPAGQDWGLAGFNPQQLEADKFRAFRATIAVAMRDAGAIRLDHVLGLARLFLIPRGSRPCDGVYVRYPLEALLAVVAQESVRHKCLVVGEDLGTVSDHLRAALASWGIWSYLVMMFERDAAGGFHPPGHYAEQALVTFNTHDLPTFAGWWSGHDLRTRHGMGIDPGETGEQRQAAYLALEDALAGQGISWRQGGEFLATVQYLALAPSRLLVVSIEDALGLEDQTNIPGTIDEHPNWRRRLPVALEDLRDCERLIALGGVLAETGRSRLRTRIGRAG